VLSEVKLGIKMFVSISTIMASMFYPVPVYIEFFAANAPSR